MFVRRWLMPTIFRAPEDDQGGGFEPLEGGGSVNDLDNDLLDDDLSGFDDDDDAPAGDQTAVDDPPARPASRGSRAIAETRRRAQEAEQRAEAAERRAAEAEARANARAQHEFAQAEQQRIAAMDPYERQAYEAAQREQGLRNQINQIQVQTWASNDRADFRDACADKPHLAKIKDEVERTFQERLRAGQPVDRNTIAAYILGKKLIEGGAKKARQSQAAAAENRQAQAARPGSARSDAGGGRGAGERRGVTLAQKLDGVNI